MFTKPLLAAMLSSSLILTNSAIGFAAPETQQAPVSNAKQTPEQLQQLVAPVALYPDELVAEVLAAATYPAQVVVADRWLQDRKNIQGKQLADEVNKQPWDSSVKALTEFPSVLANMDQESVLDIIARRRLRQSTAGCDECGSGHASEGQAKRQPQQQFAQKVASQGNSIIIEPAAPEVVYVPTYDPWVVYGAPVAAWPGWYSYPGLYVETPGISFGIGFGIGFFGGFGWGWHHWGCDWGHRSVLIDHRTYVSHNTFINRNRIDNRNAFSHTHAGFNHGSHGFATHARFSGMRAGPVHSFNHAGAAHGFHGGGGRR